MKFTRSSRSPNFPQNRLRSFQLECEPSGRALTCTTKWVSQPSHLACGPGLPMSPPNSSARPLQFPSPTFLGMLPLMMRQRINDGWARLVSTFHEISRGHPRVDPAPGLQLVSAPLYWIQYGSPSSSILSIECIAICTTHGFDVSPWNNGNRAALAPVYCAGMLNTAGTSCGSMTHHGNVPTSRRD